MDDTNTTGTLVPGSSTIAGIGMATNHEGTKVLLFPAVLLASSNDGWMVVGVLVIKGMELKIAAGGIAG